MWVCALVREREAFKTWETGSSVVLCIGQKVPCSRLTMLVVERVQIREILIGDCTKPTRELVSSVT